MVELPGTAPGSVASIPSRVYRHSQANLTDRVYPEKWSGFNNNRVSITQPSQVRYGDMLLPAQAQPVSLQEEVF